MTVVQITNQALYRGVIKFQTFRNGNMISEDVIENEITDDWLALVSSAFMTQGVDMEIKYIALGDGTTVPAASDKQLVNERFRAPLTKQNSPTTGKIDSTTYVAPYEANFQIQEVGWFGGANATGSANTGVMVARVLYNKDKNDLESLQIVRSDILARG